METILAEVKSLNSGANVLSILIAVLVAVVFGLVIYFAHRLTTDKFEYDNEFGLVLIIVPAVVALLISAKLTVVSAISIAGVLAIIRYRSVQIKARDIAFIFMSVGAGFCAGMKLYLPGVIFVVIAAVLIALYSLVSVKEVRKTLKISVPESINYAGLFDNVLAKYTTGYKLLSTSVVSGGTVIELSYVIKIKNEADSKAFLDELRVLNANFKITIGEIK